MFEDCLKGQPYQLFSNFYPRSILDSLLDVISSSKVRRIDYELPKLTRDTSEEAAVIDAADYATNKIGLSFNYAILKWYRSTDTYKSEAYLAHIDPPEFRSIPLVLGTLYGEARLTFWTSDGAENTIKVGSNDVVILDSNLMHQVSEPLNPDGVRYYFFLGKKQRRSI